MRKTLAAACVAAAIASGLGATPAAAATTYTGGCDVVEDNTNFVMYALVVVQSSTAAQNPVSASMRCDMYIGGTFALTRTYTGRGVIAGALPGGYIGFPDGDLEICTTIDYTSTADPTVSFCKTVERGATHALDPYLALLNDLVFEQVDPTICLVLRTAAPAVNSVNPALLHVDPATGDVRISGVLFWDCPPYET